MQPVTGTFFRFDALVNFTSTLSNLGISGVMAQEIIDFAKIPASSLRTDLNAIVERKFSPKPGTVGQFDPDSRFSDGTFPILYLADSEDTAKAETVSYLNRKGAFQSADRLRFFLSSWSVDTRDGYDLRHMTGRCPDLVADDYSICRRVGSALHRRGVEVFLSTSARHPTGCNAQALSRAAITNSSLVAGRELTAH